MLSWPKVWPPPGAEVAGEAAVVLGASVLEAGAEAGFDVTAGEEGALVVGVDGEEHPTANDIKINAADNSINTRINTSLLYFTVTG